MTQFYGFCSWPTEEYNLPPCYKLYADFPGNLDRRACTVLPSSSSSSSRPDILLISNDHIILLELSIITNREQHFVANSSRKEARYMYNPFLQTLNVLFAELVTSEVSCIGYFLLSLISNLCGACHLQKCCYIFF